MVSYWKTGGKTKNFNQVLGANVPETKSFYIQKHQAWVAQACFETRNNSHFLIDYTSFVIAYLITIFVIAYLISLFVMKTSFGIKYKGWVKNNLTKHLFCAFLGYHWVLNKSFAHFSIALFMQIMKMNQTQFLNFRPRYLTNFTEKIMCRSIITKVVAKMC